MTIPAKDAPRTSVLATLTAEVMETKKAEAKKLTPVEGEALPPFAKAVLPNDTGKFLSNETLWNHARDLRKFAKDAIEIADGIDALVGESSATEVIDLAAARKAREVAADAKAAETEEEEQPKPDFNADFKAKQREAQESTFNPADDTVTVEVAEVSVALDGWVCTEHHKAVEKTSAKTGRTFIGCPDCNQFKR